MVLLLTIALLAGVAYLIVRAEPKEDRAGDREKRWWPKTLVAEVLQRNAKQR